MAEAFIGLGVHVVLSNDSWVEGTVSHIDQHTQLLTLKNALVNSNGHSQQRAIYGVAGTDIQDLQILPAARPPSNPSLRRSSQAPGSYLIETTKITNGGTLNSINNPKTSISHHHEQSSKIFPQSHFVDPAIISISQAPTNVTNNSSNSYILSSSSPTYLSQLASKETQSDIITKNLTGPKSSKTGSTGDSESKYDDDDERISPRQYVTNSKLSPNSSNQNGVDSSGLESDGEMSNQKKDSRKPKQSKANGYYNNPRDSPARRNGRRRRPIKHEWAGEDVNEFKSEEFDFQGNLDLFDKEKVFAEIRELDSTAPENLLVNLNRNPKYQVNNRNGRYPMAAQQQRLASHENVLEPSNRKPNFYNTDEDDETANDAEVDSDESWNRKIKVNGIGSHRNVRIKTLTGVICPTVQPLQMVEVERIATIETGPNEDQMIENAGRGTSMMCLQALGGSRRIQPNNHNAAPLVVILAGNTKTGAYGLAAARHLSNHGCHVISCVVGKERDLLKSVKDQQKIMQPTGGKLVKSVAELPQQFTTPVDLIVDALLGYQFTLRDIKDEHERRLICDLMEWANVNKAPVLSLDMPSGVNGNTGNPGNAAHYIHPKWTLCLGAPKTGCKSRSITVIRQTWVCPLYMCFFFSQLSNFSSQKMKKSLRCISVGVSRNYS
ncbi:hypothetical protein G9A89_019074 [Geosiphon pyriformis]|nr:hypothetical protein G9A89_019074 [Geosiphon pyriformis]